MRSQLTSPSGSCACGRAAGSLPAFFLRNFARIHVSQKSGAWCLDMPGGGRRRLGDDRVLDAILNRGQDLVDVLAVGPDLLGEGLDVRGEIGDLRRGGLDRIRHAGETLLQLLIHEEPVKSRFTT